ncbi:oligosaccharide flippase family protein [Ancylomarina sp. DW003]|nr:oligosaccharide flippase family protein [Ancylomarina sp. DW003]MDE5422984.1 oligosaccharide flippase family protein [Ancylomarina sp. DW003]
MGIIRKQTIIGSTFSYSGAILGMVNTAILFPRFLSTTEVGLLTWLIATTMMVAQFSGLGFGAVISRLFPYFRDEKNQHNGFMFILFCVGILGFVISLLAYFAFQPFAADYFDGDTSFNLKYIIYLIPLVFFSLFFNLFDAYNRVLYDAVSGTFFRDIVFKLIVLGSLLLLWGDYINFNQLVFIYVSAYCLPAVLLFALLIKRKQVSFKPQLNFIKPDLKKVMIDTSFYGLLNNFGDKLASQIDKLMLTGMISLGATGIFGVMASFGILISMPSRTLNKISSTIIAEAWKKKDIATISKTYAQSGLHQFMVACLLFVGLWVNIDNVLQIVTPEYVEGKYVVFFIGLSNVVLMLSGISGVVIQNSPAYRKQSLFLIIYAGIIVISNAIMIPLWGIVGAAAASFAASLCFNLMKYVFLLKRYKFQPLNYRYLLVIVSAVVSYYIAYLLPKQDAFIIDIILRGASVSFIYIALSLMFRISTDFNEFVMKLIKR